MEASSRPEANVSAAPGSSPRRIVTLAGSVFVLVFAVAVGSNRSLARVGGPPPLLDGGVVARDLALALVLPAFLVLAVAVAAVLSRRPRRRRRGDEPEWVIEQPDLPWWEKPLMLALALLPLAALAAALVFLVGHGRRSGQTPVRPVPGAAGPGGSTQGLAPRTTPAAGTGVHWWVWLLVAVAAAVLVGAALAVRRRRAGSRGVEARLGATRDVQELLEESLRELASEPDPRRAVIRAYGGMERALARRGMGRRPFEAPLEYLARALGAIHVSGPAGRRLTALFERARFSEHAIDEGMKRDAIDALASVRDELAERAR